MSSLTVSGAQIVAARALVGVGRAKLSARAGVDARALEKLEACGLSSLPETDESRRVVATLEELGALFVGESEGRGCGVRLKFSRGVTGAIGKWEAEGGLPADDEVP